MIKAGRVLCEILSYSATSPRVMDTSSAVLLVVRSAREMALGSDSGIDLSRVLISYKKLPRPHHKA